MIIINTNTLTKETFNEVQTLIHPGTPIFLEADMNYYEDFPCFYLLYEDKKLSAFLSVFIPHEDECEVYAFTDPLSRKKGYFTKLLKMARQNIKKYKIQTTLLVSESRDNSDIAELHSSDFMLAYDVKNLPIPSGTLDLKKQIKENTFFYKSYLNDKCIGGGICAPTGKSHMIYEFEILELERGKGFGKETLLLILKDLIESGITDIILHIYGDNHIAKKMYLENGFVITRQLDYWRLS